MNSRFKEIPSIEKLQMERFKKDIYKKEMFKIVLDRCIEKIIYTNRFTQKTYVNFEVPKVLIGKPNYDLNSCVIYMRSELHKKQYMTEFIEPNILYVDWCTNDSIIFQKGSSKKNKVVHGLGSIKLENKEKVAKQTMQLIEQFPNVKEFVFEYAKESDVKNDEHSFAKEKKIKPKK